MAAAVVRLAAAPAGAPLAHPTGRAARPVERGMSDGFGAVKRCKRDLLYALVRFVTRPKCPLEWGPGPSSWEAAQVPGFSVRKCLLKTICLRDAPLHTRGE